MLNMNNRVILDASALLALIQEETGAEIIKPLLKFSVMSVVNVTETLSVLQMLCARYTSPPLRQMRSPLYTNFFVSYCHPPF